MKFVASMSDGLREGLPEGCSVSTGLVLNLYGMTC